jgi:hypothetical protein
MATSNAAFQQRVETILDRLEKLVDEHDKILVKGNGKPSLQETVRNVEKLVTELADARKQETADRTAAETDQKIWARRAWLNPLIASVVTGFVMVIEQGVWYMVQIKPMLDRLAAAAK